MRNTKAYTETIYLSFALSSLAQPLSNITNATMSMTMRVRASSTAVLLLALVAITLNRVGAYPIIAEIDEDDETCFTYNVPHGDDAHMVFTALPHHVEDDVEDWFVSHMNEMTRKGGDQFMKELPETPDSIKKVVDEAKEERTAVSLRVQAPRQPIIVRRQFKWYDPIILRDVVAISKAENPLGGYSICFDNNSDKEVRVLMDVVLVSDKGEAGAAKKKKGLQKEHLTPLERNFQESIGAAHKILNEMHYMERREARMRHTAESTNKRIRFFSYVSVAILLGVTYVQVTYLRSYFKKKKLL